MNTRLIIFSLAATVATVQSASATAVPIGGDTARSVVISSGDLDLRAPAGRQTLARRLSGAIDRVCGKLEGQDLDRNMVISRCHKKAGASADLQVERLVRPLFAAANDTLQVRRSR